MPFGALKVDKVKELILIQNELKIGKNNKKQGIQFSYRTCSDILERVKPICQDHGVLLYLSDDIIERCGQPYIESTATVEKDGIKISCKGIAKEPTKLMSMSAPQITGSCSSYARKTALGGLFAIDDNEDPDSVDNNKKTKKSNEEVNIKQQILNRLSTLTEDEKSGYRKEVQAGNWQFNQSFLDHLTSKYGDK